MACGARLYILAGGATVLIVLLQCLFHINCKAFNRKKYYSVKIVFTKAKDDVEKLKKLFKVDRFTDFTATYDGGKVTYKAKLNTSMEVTATQIEKIIEDNPYIISLERSDSE